MPSSDCKGTPCGVAGLSGSAGLPVASSYADASAALAFGGGADAGADAARAGCLGGVCGGTCAATLMLLISTVELMCLAAAGCLAGAGAAAVLVLMLVVLLC